MQTEVIFSKNKTKWSQNQNFLHAVTGANNEPAVENFGYEATAVPGELREGEISIETLYLSLDPALVSISFIL